MEDERPKDWAAGGSDRQAPWEKVCGRNPRSLPTYYIPAFLRYLR